MAKQTSKLVSPAYGDGTGTASDPASSSLPSNRKFGAFFATVFVIAGAYAWWSAGASFAIALLVLAAVFGTLTLVRPGLLAGLNRAWWLLGQLLGRIVSPVVLGVLLFLVITPVAVVTRAFGRDALWLRKRPVRSHWKERTPVGPSPESFKNQF